MRESDIVVVGAGIIGLATAHALTRRQPGVSITVLEKEPTVAWHQSGHNSGVLHSGIYYAPGSLKARLCREGVDRMFSFCDRYAVPYDRCGKLIVATSDEELPRLDALYERGVANGVPDLQRVDAAQLKDLDPNVWGVAGLLSPTTAVLNFQEVARKLGESLLAEGVSIRTDSTLIDVAELDDGVRIETSDGSYKTGMLINCAGLQSDRIARKMGIETEVRIIPFRGQYFEVKQTPETQLRHLIYPVPDPRFPFLGVHVSKTIDAKLKAGPNAVLALGREGYTRRGANRRDAWATLTYPGFWSLARQHWRYGMAEYKRSLSKKVFLRDVQRLVPGIRIEDLTKSGAGVRAQAVGRDGTIFDDFVIERTPTSVHVVNAPSPGATASFAIGDYVASQALGTASPVVRS